MIKIGTSGNPDTLKDALIDLVDETIAPDHLPPYLREMYLADDTTRAEITPTDATMLVREAAHKKVLNVVLDDALAEYTPEEGVVEVSTNELLAIAYNKVSDRGFVRARINRLSNENSKMKQALIPSHCWPNADEICEQAQDAIIRIWEYVEQIVDNVRTRSSSIVFEEEYPASEAEFEEFLTERRNWEENGYLDSADLDLEQIPDRWWQ